jgi:uncharacterized delta-60 repeat protein
MWSIARGLPFLALGGLVLGAAAGAAAAPGDLDPTFGAGGTVVTDLGGADYPGAVALQPDGKIVVAGARSIGPAATPRSGIVLVRYRSGGTLDATFGTGGLVVTELGDGTIAWVVGVALQPDGKVVVAGGMAILADRARDGLPVRDVLYGLARYTSSGELDASFGTGGGRALDFFPESLTLQPDGKILVVGHRAADFVVARVIGDSSTVSIATDRAASRPADVATTPFVPSP